MFRDGKNVLPSMPKRVSRNAKKYRRHAKAACSDAMIFYVARYFDKVGVSGHVDVLYLWTVGYGPPALETATFIKPLHPRL